MSGCDQEMCENWTGDGNVCACVMFDLPRRPMDEATGSRVAGNGGHHPVSPVPSGNAGSRERLDRPAAIASLTFAAFREANLARCRRWHDGFPEADSWSLADWSNALCGEAGELANVVKKIRRHETGHKPGAQDPSLDELHAMAADEIGDVFAYLDLVATRLGLRLEDCAVRKFNRVSEREGYPERLPS
jgi:NTP pyrophosphatase (non-canonical NTP hydrolase)